MNDPLFHRFLKQVEPYSERTFYLGISGGLDSMALLHLMSESREVLKTSLTALHVHHGDVAHPSLQQFRDEARDLVVKACETLEVPCRVAKVEEDLAADCSEAELRRVRYRAFQSLIDSDSQRRAPHSSDLLVLAHQKEEVLETQLIHLIRGAGLSGLVGVAEFQKAPGNQFFRGAIARPLIRESKSTLREYLKAVKFPFIDDPSNEDTQSLRTWIRNEWLPKLDKKRPGSSESFSRSFRHLSNLLSDTSSHLVDMALSSEQGLDRARFRKLTVAEKTFVLREYLTSQGLRGAGERQIEELIKRMRSPKKELQFHLLGRSWTVCQNWIKVSGADVT